MAFTLNNQRRLHLFLKSLEENSDSVCPHQRVYARYNVHSSNLQYYIFLFSFLLGKHQIFCVTLPEFYHNIKMSLIRFFCRMLDERQIQSKIIWFLFFDLLILNDFRWQVLRAHITKVGPVRFHSKDCVNRPGLSCVKLARIKPRKRKVHLLI